jgi:hypothetical protein
MSLNLWMSHFYLLVHDYNRHVREAQECHDGNDLGEPEFVVVTLIDVNRV